MTDQFDPDDEDEYIYSMEINHDYLIGLGHGILGTLAVIVMLITIVAMLT